VLGAPEAFGAGAERLRLWRRVSWTPGAEGAPRTWGVVVVVVVAGTMRRDYVYGVSLGGILEVVVVVKRVCVRTIVSGLVVPGGRPFCVFGGVLVVMYEVWVS